MAIEKARARGIKNQSSQNSSNISSSDFEGDCSDILVPDVADYGARDLKELQCRISSAGTESNGVLIHSTVPCDLALSLEINCARPTRSAGQVDVKMRSEKAASRGNDVTTVFFSVSVSIGPEPFALENEISQATVGIDSSLVQESNDAPISTGSSTSSEAPLLYMPRAIYRRAQVSPKRKFVTASELTSSAIPIDPSLVAMTETSGTDSNEGAAFSGGTIEGLHHHNVHVLQYVKSARNGHLRMIRAIRALQMPYLGLDDICYLLKTAQIPLGSIPPRPVYDELALSSSGCKEEGSFDSIAHATSDQETLTDSHEVEEKDEGTVTSETADSFVDFRSFPDKSNCPELYITMKRDKSNAKNHWKVEENYRETVQRCFQSGNKQDIKSLIETHESCRPAHQKTWDPSQVWYPLGCVPTEEWRSFIGHFGESYYDDKVFNVQEFLRPPPNAFEDSRITQRCPELIYGESTAVEIREFMELNLYDPFYTQETRANGRESWCGICQIWLQRDKSNWLHHMKSCHGIRSSSGLAYPLPLIIATRPDKSKTKKKKSRGRRADGHGNSGLIAYCDECQSWQNLNGFGGYSAFNSWFLHIAAHDVSRNKNSLDEPSKKSRKDRNYMQIKLERFQFECRRRTLIDIHHLVADHSRFAGNIKALHESRFLASKKNYWLFHVPKSTEFEAYKSKAARKARPASKAALVDQTPQPIDEYLENSIADISLHENDI